MKAKGRVCSIKGCGRPHYARGWCRIHYHRWNRHGDPPRIVGPGGRPTEDNTSACSVAGCNERVKARGLCNAHWLRLRRHGSPLGGATPRGDVVGSPARFLREVVLPYEGNDCLLWPFASTMHGRAHMRVDGTDISVQRFVCERANGPAPSPFHQAAHSCGMGHLGCVAPGHLRWATGSENAADRLVHGTDHRGSKHPNAKLTEEDVATIRVLLKRGTARIIAARYGISEASVYSIKAGRTWGWLK